MTGIGAPPEVDVPTAKELIEQIHEHVTVDELGVLVSELEHKSNAVRELLLPTARVDDAAVRAALEWTFAGRRRASAIMGTRDSGALRAWVSDLLDGGSDLPARFERFCSAAGPLTAGAAAELAAELLHFSRPERHWLWSRWVWSNDSRTGALPLLIGEAYDLEGDNAGDTYERVGTAMRALDESPEASAFRLRGGGPFGTDVLLACTYGVYMRTVLGLKMTQEFNALVPSMPELVRRLLGTHSRAPGPIHEEVA